ncbi:MAG TPA: hypothetical protein VGP93_09150, partial [Polyangiaceae bacterium]|nr:hypothetical protein [Polyangiaceae bacterium]
MVVDTDRGVVALDESLNFGTSLPEFQSPHGFLENPDPRIKHSSPLMWVQALDLLLERIKAKGFPLGQVAGISGAGQQHGSVYLRSPVAGVGGWTKDRSLREQVQPLLSRSTSPIWMDSSTTAECRELAEA